MKCSFYVVLFSGNDGRNFIGSKYERYFIFFLWGASKNCEKTFRLFIESSEMLQGTLREKCPHFPAFGLNMERYGVSLRIQSECGKMRTRITPKTNTFYVVEAFFYALFTQFKFGILWFSILYNATGITFEDLSTWICFCEFAAICKNWSTQKGIRNNSFFENNKIFINHMLLIFKLYVYKSREKKFININSLIAEIQNVKRIEEENASNN